MGGGNGNKAMLTRERNAKKAQAQKKGGVNQKEAAQKAMTLVCQICRTQFMNTCEIATLFRFCADRRLQPMRRR
jgi:hypothetical protein